MNTELLIEMLKHYGLKELDGPASNPEIIAMGKDLGYDIDDDSTFAWCSLCLNYFAKKTGYERSNSLVARSWLKVGTPIEVPEIGDIAVIWRVDIDSWEGHVGVYVSESEDFVYLCGGNQSNSLNIMPYRKNRVLGYRRLNKL